MHLSSNPYLAKGESVSQSLPDRPFPLPSSIVGNYHYLCAISRRDKKIRKNKVFSCKVSTFSKIYKINSKTHIVMKEKFKKAVLAGLALMAVASCGTHKANVGNDKMAKSDEFESMEDNYIFLSGTQRNLINRNNTFALNLFKEVSGMDSRVISPLSVTYLMGMLANGADGQTRNDILKTLGWEGVSVTDINTLSKLIMEKAGKSDPATTLSIANYIAVNKRYKLKKDFADTVSENYKAGIESLDFTSASTKGHINAWCDKQTHGMIPKIIDNVEPSAVSYLMNAIYFNSTWTEKFEKKLTKEERFQGYTRDIKKVLMMHNNEKYMYTSNDSYAAVCLPYGNGTYEMTVLLPNTDKSIREVLDDMDVQQLDEIRRSMSECIVDLKLPRFTTELSLPLNEIISKLGASSIFNPAQADFSNFAKGDLYISKMLQKAKIEVSEEGTKAAAVTAAVMAMSSLSHQEPRRVQFHANRPFVYFIRERNTGAIFFMGQFTGE